jgi:multisubunit Na+/H+ antiporter MnhC subunit
MNKKAFNIGWIMYVILMIVSYFILPVENVFAAIMVLTLIFGAFNIYLWSKAVRKKEDIKHN